MFPTLHLPFNIHVPTYPLLLSLIYSLGIFWIYRRSITKNYPQEIALDLCFAITIGGFLGARSLHIFYENPQFYIIDPSNVYRIWQGGFVFYGGALGAFFFSYLLLKAKKESLSLALDFFTPVLALGYGLGRIACFLNGCCYGKICELPWAVHFPLLGEAEPILRHPTQIYATIWELGVFLLLISVDRKYSWTQCFPKFKTGGLFLTWIFFHSIGRLLMESFRDDFRGPALPSFTSEHLSVSSWISLTLLLLSISLLFKFRRPRNS